MHELPVFIFDRTGDIFPVIYIDGSQQQDGEGLANSYREPIREGVADLD